MNRWKNTAQSVKNQLLSYDVSSLLRHDSDTPLLLSVLREFSILCNSIAESHITALTPLLSTHREHCFFFAFSDARTFLLRNSRI
jgi:hypothetical protein